MAHILPHWNWPERKGLVTPVHVYTSGDSAELFLNGKSLGVRKKGPYIYRLVWDNVIYQPGELKVIAWRNGSKWAADSVATTGKPDRISMTSDRAIISAGGSDLAFITVAVEDSKGQKVPRSDNTINFTIEGPGEIVATDNGDATSHVPFSSTQKKSFNGLCLVIVKGLKNSSDFTLRAESKGLKSSSIKIRTSGGI